jgi:membrane protein implicated in regulation of membrane protease activity
MATLLTLYSVCFGVGLLYVLIAGAMGMHGAGGHGDVAGGHEGGLDLHADSGGGAEAGAVHAGGDAAGESAESAALAVHADDAGANAHDAATGAQASAAEAAAGTVEYSPFNLLSIMCFIASFGGTGLIASTLGVATILSFPLALAGGFFVAWLLYLLLTRVFFRMQSGTAASVDDMLGLEAEVLTPIEPGGFGEVAFVMQGTRYTAPARLARGERAGRADSVRIVKVEAGTVYVEVRRQLL